MTKKILLVAATELEIKPLLQKINFKADFDINFKKIQIDNVELDILITSVGMVATAFHLTRTLSDLKYDFVINAGICGSFDKSYNLGEVVHVVEDTFPEIGIGMAEGITPIVLKNSYKKNSVITYLINENQIITPILRKIKKVKGVTVNTISGTQQKVDMLNNMFHPDIESMEGAAFLYVCNAFKQPCAQIRSISNEVGNRDKKEWNIDLAVNNLANIVFDIIQELK